METNTKGIWWNSNFQFKSYYVVWKRAYLLRKDEEESGV